MAIDTASERLAAPIFAYSAMTCSFTMPTLMPNCLAMSVLDSPRVIDSNTSR